MVLLISQISDHTLLSKRFDRTAEAKRIVLAEEMARMNVEELARQLNCSTRFFHPLSVTCFPPHFIITGLMVNRKFAVHPIERNHYITLAIGYFNDKAFKLHCKDYDK